MAESVLWDYFDHTAAKHRVLRAYLDAWIPVMGQQELKVAGVRGISPRLLLVDGFAGPGRYKRGEPGSPLIMLEALAKHKDRDKIADVQFTYLFIEYNSKRVEYLRKELREFDIPPNAQVEVRKGKFEQTFRDFVQNANLGEQFPPTFAFIDPFGYSNAPLSRVGWFFDFQRTEALIFLPLTDIARFVGKADQGKTLTELFDSDRWQQAKALDLPERKACLLSLFEEQLLRHGHVKYVRSFQLLTSRRKRDYRLVFATGHPRGFELMKEAMWSVDPEQGTRYLGSTITGQQVLFQRKPDTGPLLRTLREHFGERWFTIEEAESVTAKSDYLVKRHLKTLTLKPAEDRGELDVQRREGGRRGTFPAGVRMRFTR